MKMMSFSIIPLQNCAFITRFTYNPVHSCGPQRSIVKGLHCTFSSRFGIYVFSLLHHMMSHLGVI